MKKNLAICLTLVFVIIFAIAFNNNNNNVLEGYNNVDFPANYCSKFSQQPMCENNWQSKPYTTALLNNGFQLGGNPCTWDGSYCDITSSASDYNYTFESSTV